MNNVVRICSVVNGIVSSRMTNQSNKRTNRLRGFGAKGSDWTTVQIPPIGLVQRKKIKARRRKSCKTNKILPNVGLTNN